MKTDISMHSMTLMYSWEMKPGKLIDNAVLYALCGSCITKGAVGVYKENRNWEVTLRTGLLLIRFYSTYCQVTNLHESISVNK